MAYDTAELRCMRAGMSGSYDNEWLYDTVDAVSTVRVTGYISDGVVRGMNVGDTVRVRVWDTSVRSGTLSATSVLTVVSKGTASVDLSDGTALSLTDTD